MPFVRRGVPRQLHRKSPVTQVMGRWEGSGAMLGNDSITAPPDSGSEAESESKSDGFLHSCEKETRSSRSASETPSPFSESIDDDEPPTTAATTAVCQLGGHRPGPQNAEKREGTTRGTNKIA